MVKAFFWVVVGAIGALEAERWLDRVWDRVRPRAVTDAMFDKVNARLEKDRAR